MTEIKNDVSTKGRHHNNHHNNSITKETRQEAYITRPITRATDIIKFIGDKELTSRQIAYGMGFTDLNSVRPRLTELKEEGKVEVVGKSYDEVTKRNVALWRVVQ